MIRKINLSFLFPIFKLIPFDLRAEGRSLLRKKKQIRVLFINASWQKSFYTRAIKTGLRSGLAPLRYRSLLQIPMNNYEIACQLLNVRCACARYGVRANRYHCSSLSNICIIKSNFFLTNLFRWSFR